MRQTKYHKLLFINTLHIFNETFETNETVFQCFSPLSLFLHILNAVLVVSFSLIPSHLVSFSLILSHF